MKAVIKDEIAEFTTLIAAGVEAWLRAGEIVVRSLDADPEWIDKVCLRCPEITPETVLAFDRVGRKKLHPRLLLSNKPGAARLRSLPIELQEKYLVAPIPVLIKNGAKVEDLAVSVWNLTVEQCRQAFDGDSLRSLGAQRAWLESRQPSGLPLEVSEPYRIRGHMLEVMEPCRISVKKLLALAGEMA